MKHTPCNPELRNTVDCPLASTPGGCYEDLHHGEYPRSEYKTKVEKAHRDQPFSKARLCRAIHDAIHLSGYVPDKLDRDTMLAEIWSDEEQPARAEAEIERQIAIGQQTLGLVMPEPEGAA